MYYNVVCEKRKKKKKKKNKKKKNKKKKNKTKKHNNKQTWISWTKLTLSMPVKLLAEDI